jgi:hypothetical protein
VPNIVLVHPKLDLKKREYGNSMGKFTVKILGETKRSAQKLSRS